MPKPMLKALYADSITLHLIEDDNLADVCALFQGYPDSRDMLQELLRTCLPQYENGRRINYDFYVMLDNELAGITLFLMAHFQGYRTPSAFIPFRGWAATRRVSTCLLSEVT